MKYEVVFKNYFFVFFMLKKKIGECCYFVLIKNFYNCVGIDYIGIVCKMLYWIKCLKVFMIL